MYTRITKSDGRQYLQLVESFSNDSGKVRTRVIANLGRLDQITPEKIDPLINGLNPFHLRAQGWRWRGLPSSLRKDSTTCR